MIKLSSQHKEALINIKARKEFPIFLDWLKVQRNNIGIIQWARVESTDPLIAIKKAKYEGKVEMIKDIITIFETISKKEDEE